MQTLDGERKYRIGNTSIWVTQDLDTGEWLAFFNAIPRLTAVADSEEKAIGRLVIKLDARHAEIDAFKAQRKKSAERRKKNKARGR